MSAADRIVRILEDVLSAQLIHQCPIHIIPSLFSAMTVQSINLCTNDAALRELSYSKIQISMIALRELQDTYPVTSWISGLLAQLIRRCRDLKAPEEPASASNYSGSRANTTRTNSFKTDSDRMSMNQDGPRSPRSMRLSIRANSYPTEAQESLDKSFAAWEAQTIFIPFNLSVDWIGVLDRHGDLLPEDEFDF
jgi:hypothetical protein